MTKKLDRKAFEKLKPEQKALAHMAGAAPDGSWWVWTLGLPNPFNQGRRAKYNLGHLDGKLTREQAIKAAQKNWPKWKGQMVLEKY